MFDQVLCVAGLGDGLTTHQLYSRQDGQYMEPNTWQLAQQVHVRWIGWRVMQEARLILKCSLTPAPGNPALCCSGLWPGGAAAQQPVGSSHTVLRPWMNLKLQPAT